MLAHYAEGKLEEHQQQELQQWLQEHPDHTLILAEVVAIYEQDRQLDTTEKYSPYKTAPALQRFMEQIAHEKPAVRKLWHPFRITAAAAALLFLLGISYLFISRDGRHMADNNKNGAGTAAVHWKKIVSAPGRVVNVTLTDGSVVRLAPGSTLQYPESFGDRERLVRLEGEAFFEVTKDARHPFIVQTRKLSTRVLGTSFNIEAYSAQLFSKVTLITGKIAIGRMQEQEPDSVLAVLVPNQSITVSNEDSSFTVSRVKSSDADAIREGKLLFDGATMKEVAYKLELHYGIKVYLENATVEGVLFTGTFEHIALDKLTGMIAETTGLHIKRDGNNLYISHSGVQ